MKQREGFVLVSVLVIVFLGSMLVMSLLFQMGAASKASSAGLSGQLASSAAWSGIARAMQVAALSADGSLSWRDDPNAFRQQSVGDDGADRWFFSVYTANDDDSEPIRFGLSDEAGKLNLNRATEERLLKLPKMNSALVDALLDFIDADDETRAQGAERDYYGALSTSYSPANGPLQNLDQVLLVRGFTPALWYGEDANLNFQLEPNENDGDLQFPQDNDDGELDAGIRRYYTITAYELNVDRDGKQRVDLNDSAAELPADGSLPQAAQDYIAALRRANVKLTHPAELLEAKGKFKDAQGREIEMESSIGKEELPALLDGYTVGKARQSIGLLNVNTASALVLATVPGIDQTLADAIAAARVGISPENRRTIGWLFSEGIVDAQKFKEIAPHLTARSYQFHFHVVGYSLPSGQFKVLEAEIDLASSPPRVVYVRDLTRAGLPFAIIDEKEGGGRG